MENWIQTPFQVVRNCKGGQLKVLLYLSIRNNHPTKIKEIKKSTGLSETTIRKHIRALEKEQLIEVERKKGQASIYKVNLEIDKGYSWVKVPVAAIAKCSGNTLKLLSYIRFRAGKKTTYASVRTMARELSLSTMTIYRHLKKLVQLKLIEITHRKGYTSLYKPLLAERFYFPTPTNDLVQTDNSSTISFHKEPTAITLHDREIAKNKLFELINNHAKRKGLKHKKDFMTEEQEKLFFAAVDQLGAERTVKAIQRAMVIGITSLSKIISYVYKVSLNPQHLEYSLVPKQSIAVIDIS